MINFSHKIITNNKKIFLKISKFYSLFFTNNIIRILVYHDIKKKDFKLLYKNLKDLKKNWKFISPKQLENHLNKKNILKGKNLLVTFDDGFKSNLDVEKKILSKLGIKAIFFIPSDFIRLKSKKKIEEFSKKILNTKKIDETDSISNLSISDTKKLIKCGHTIGCHTKTHLNLGSIKNDKILNNEIFESAKSLENDLKIKINHFAFTYGNFESMSEKSLKLASSRYNFIYSCLRGNNFNNKKKKSYKKRPSIFK